MTSLPATPTNTPLPSPPPPPDGGQPIAAPRPVQPSPSGPTPTGAPTLRMPGAPGSRRMGCRVVYYTPEGFGKSTFGAFGEAPVMCLAPDELGYLALQSRGLVPTVPYVIPRTWRELLAHVEAMIADQQGIKTWVGDALVGFETLLATQVCNEQFGGKWGEKGFGGFGRGAKVVQREFPGLLQRLTALASKGVNVVLLGHAKVDRYENPTGPSYDRFDCNTGAKEVWVKTKAWAEAVFFGEFRPLVETARDETNIAKAHGKAIAYSRILRCQQSPAADAKNQYGLAPEYSLSDDPRACALGIWNLIRGGN